MRASKLAPSLSRALCLALAAGIASVAYANAPDPATLKKLSTLAVPFVPNAGQWDSRAAFAAQTFAGTLFVTTQGELVYSLPGKPIESNDSADSIGCAARTKSTLGAQSAPYSASCHARTQHTPGWTLSETLVDASGRPRSMASSTLKAPAGYRPMQASVSYFIGSDEAKHAKSLNTFERVNLGDMYPGINVQLRATGNNIEKIFTVAPSYDPKQISIALKGADKLEIGKLGELIAHTGNGPVSFTAPIAFQETASGERSTVAVAYAVDAVQGSYRFTLGDYDQTQPLIIDPLLRSTYLGAAGTDVANAVAIHPASGEVYVAGYTSSATTTFPGVSGGAQGTSGGGSYDAFVSRFSADLGTLLRSSYLGAAGSDVAYALVVHPASGEVYVAGSTSSATTTFPGVSGGAQAAYGGVTDAFVSRFSADLGTLLRSTYLGAALGDAANALAIHPASGEVYVAGITSSATTTFPGASGGAQGTFGGNTDAFVSRFSADLGTLLRSTYLGAAGFEQATALTIHPASGEVYVAGYADSTTNSFPGVSGGAQGSFGGGFNDAFVSRFSADLTATNTTPAAFAFATQTNVPLASTRTSNPALITGIVGAANIYVDGAFGSSYCVSSASNCLCDISTKFVTTPGTVTNNSYVCARHMSASIANEVVRSKLHVGGAAASFISTTGTLFTSCNLDIDGSGGAPNAVTDGLMLVRAMLGLTGTAVTNGAIIGTPPRNTWPLIRDYLNGNCGTNFLP